MYIQALLAMRLFVTTAFSEVCTADVNKYRIWLPSVRFGTIIHLAHRLQDDMMPFVE
jgi:hypothetical protein